MTTNVQQCFVCDVHHGRKLEVEKQLYWIDRKMTQSGPKRGWAPASQLKDRTEGKGAAWPGI